MTRKSFKVKPKRKEDQETARRVSAVLNSEPIASAISKAMGEAYADLMVFGDMKPPRFYMEKHLPAV